MEWQWIVAILLYVNTVEGLESNDSCQSKEIDSSSSLEKEMNRLQGIHDEYCSEVVLKPGSYTIKTNFVLNNSNISIRGNSSYAPVSITFELGERIAPLYYLLFRNSDMVEIRVSILKTVQVSLGSRELTKSLSEILRSGKYLHKPKWLLH